MDKETTKMIPGDELHLTMLMAPYSLNLVTGQDRQHLLAYGRAAFDAGKNTGQATPCLNQIAEPVTAGAAVRAFRDYLGVHDGIKLGGQAMDDMALDLARIALDFKHLVESQHPDEAAVDALAALMKAKLAEKRAKGYGGWNDKTQCPQQRLSDMLRAHVDKGDPVDVANFCAMLSARGEGIAAAPQAVQAAEGVANEDEAFEKWWSTPHVWGLGHKAAQRSAFAAGVAHAAATQPAAQGMDAIRALIAQHSKELEHNHYAYFELAYTRQTGWMAWITDHPRSMPPTKVANPDRKVLASGQGDTPDAACADALAAQAKQGGA